MYAIQVAQGNAIHRVQIIAVQIAVVLADALVQALVEAAQAVKQRKEQTVAVAVLVV